MLTIVMYHYVRDASSGRFPNMKCLAVDKFYRQLDHFTRNYTVVSPFEVFDAVASGQALIGNTLLMTFDDGYIEHFEVVRPALMKRGMAAAFFPVGAVLAERKMLGINKIHLVLGTGQDVLMLNSRLQNAVERYRRHFELAAMETYRVTYAHASRFDDAETIFFKRMLQVGLPEPARTMILDELFRDIVAEDEAAIAREFYMDAAHLERMAQAGMYVGCHGYSHDWMDHLSPEQQAADLDKAVAVLSGVHGVDPLRMFCYPFGGFNFGLVELLRCRGFSTGVTVEARRADLGCDDPLVLPRLNTVQLPFS
jgi:peptidoglycan/xylan/chitin deacetylase (PgdA/CDA1 family)